MLQSDAHGDALGLHLDAGGGQVVIDVAGGMARGEHHRAAKLVLRLLSFVVAADRLHAHDRLVLDDETRHAGLKTDLATNPMILSLNTNIRMAAEAPCWQKTLRIFSTLPRFFDRV